MNKDEFNNFISSFVNEEYSNSENAKYVIKE